MFVLSYPWSDEPSPVGAKLSSRIAFLPFAFAAAMPVSKTDETASAEEFGWKSLQPTLHTTAFRRDSVKRCSFVVTTFTIEIPESTVTVAALRTISDWDPVHVRV